MAAGASLPDWLKLNAVSWTFYGSPTYADSGILTIMVTIYDNYGGTLSTSFTITVNSIPTISSVNGAVPSFINLR